MQDVVQGLPVGRGLTERWGEMRVRHHGGRTGWGGSKGELREDSDAWVLSGRPWSEMGAHLHRTLKFLPSATCCRDRLLPMASTRVTMSEPKPEDGWGHA